MFAKIVAMLIKCGEVCEIVARAMFEARLYASDDSRHRPRRGAARTVMASFSDSLVLRQTDRMRPRGRVAIGCAACHSLPVCSI